MILAVILLIKDNLQLFVANIGSNEESVTITSPAASNSTLKGLSASQIQDLKKLVAQNMKLLRSSQFRDIPAFGNLIYTQLRKWYPSNDSFQDPLYNRWKKLTRKKSEAVTPPKSHQATAQSGKVSRNAASSSSSSSAPGSKNDEWTSTYPEDAKQQNFKLVTQTGAHGKVTRKLQAVPAVGDRAREAAIRAQHEEYIARVRAEKQRIREERKSKPVQAEEPAPQPRPPYQLPWIAPAVNYLWNALTQQRQQQQQLQQQKEAAEAEARRIETANRLSEWEQLMESIKGKLNATSSDDRDAALSTAHAPEDMLEYLQNVYINQSHMLQWTQAKLSSIPFLVYQFIWIQELNLSENKLKTVPGSLLQLTNLRRLLLHSNLLTRLPPLINCTKLEMIDLHNNQLIELPDLQFMVNLQSLDCEKNRIMTFPAGIEFCTKLQYLNLRRNLIKIVPSALGLFATLKLQYLHLRNNPIVNLPPEVYQQGMYATLNYLKDQTGIVTRRDNSIKTNLVGLLASGILADVSLELSNGEHVMAHQFILRARCPVIRKMLESAGPANGPISILVPDIERDQMMYLLEFIYGDVVNIPTPVLFDSKSPQNLSLAEAHHFNEKLMISYKNTVNQCVQVSKRFQLPYMQMLAEALVAGPSNLAESTFEADMKSVMHDMFSSDVTLTHPSDPQFVVNAHKALLAARSPFFAAMFTTGLAESTSSMVSIPELSPPVARSVLEFCYTDEVEELDPDHVLDLLYVAKKYQLPRLRTDLESIVGYSLDVNNVCSILDFAWTQHLKILAKACGFFILSNMHLVTRHPDWRLLNDRVRQRLESISEKWNREGPSGDLNM